MKRTVWFVLGLLLAVGGTVAAGGGYFGWPKVFDFTSITVGGNTVWHAGNDGAGSGLDADTLRGRNMDDECLGGYNGGNRVGLNECLSNKPEGGLTPLVRDVCTHIPYVTHAKVVLVWVRVDALSSGNVGQRHTTVTFHDEPECKEEGVGVGPIAGGPISYAYDSADTPANAILGTNSMIVPVIVTPGRPLYAKMDDDTYDNGRAYWRVIGYMD